MKTERSFKNFKEIKTIIELLIKTHLKKSNGEISLNFNDKTVILSRESGYNEYDKKQTT